MLYAHLDIDFVKEYEVFSISSRTAKVLKLLEDKSSFEVDEYADELLPSINLLLGYELEGSGHNIENESLAYAGVSLEWPFPDQVDRANYETSKIELRKTKLSSETTHERLFTDLKNLDNQMQREKELIEVADEKIELAEAIVRVQIRISAAKEALIRDGDIRKALQEAHFVASISRQVDREQRTRLGGRPAEGITPLQALEVYLESRKTPPDRAKRLMEYGEKLIREL